ncbi:MULTISPECIES: hypothetical protein [unclassified Caballeronia]|nr:MULTISPECIES: hypothetical protein [unclassified Caballeronia]MDR5817726.1 hypothetical protein [Caballeronia sp. LZ033]MDR5824667.1 hypothetical protein [Caballeronia sp. LZ043]MDR5882562.1 hypothetical protein [Caballeronia sp. LZ032]
MQKIDRNALIKSQIAGGTAKGGGGGSSSSSASYSTTNVNITLSM